MNIAMLYNIHCAMLAGLLILAPTTPASAGPAQAAWERPAPAVSRIDRAALLGITAAGKRMVAVGERGLVAYSDDDGRTWSQARTPVSVTLTKAFFVSSSTGWAVGHGGVILRTDDAGATWVKQLDGIQAARLAAAKYVENATDPALRRLAPVASQLQSDGADKPFFDLVFLDAERGLAIGAYGLVFRTEDGGRRWEPVLESLENPRGLHLYALARIGATVVIAGEQGLLLKSTDGGRRFGAIPAPYKGSYFGAVSLEGGDLYIFGLLGNAFRSTDQGRSWTRLETPSAGSLNSAAALSGTAAVFTNQEGQVLVGTSSATSLRIAPGIAPAAYTAIARTAAGVWLLASLRGPVRVDAARLSGAAELPPHATK
jgi:photosystem II stability/assembly factor-like uncharacterized protein